MVILAARFATASEFGGLTGSRTDLFLGDFLAVLPETVGREALTVAEGLRASLACEPMPVPGEEDLRITCCYGVVEYAATDVDGGSMLARADTALYRAKALGRNRVEFDGSP